MTAQDFDVIEQALDDYPSVTACEDRRAAREALQRLRLNQGNVLPVLPEGVQYNTIFGWPEHKKWDVYLSAGTENYFGEGPTPAEAAENAIKLIGGA